MMSQSREDGERSYKMLDKIKRIIKKKGKNKKERADRTMASIEPTFINTAALATIIVTKLYLLGQICRISEQQLSSRWHWKSQKQLSDSMKQLVGPVLAQQPVWPALLQGPRGMVGTSVVALGVFAISVVMLSVVLAAKVVVWSGVIACGVCVLGADKLSAPVIYII